MTTTFTTLLESKPSIEKALKPFIKKAEKYGATVTVTYGEPYTVKIDGWKYAVVDGTMEYDIVGLKGFSPVAKIEHFDNANVVYSFPGITAPAEWSHFKPFCQHCNQMRARRVTFMVKNGSDIRQVGSSCLKEYTGIDPSGIACYYDIVNFLRERDYREEDGDALKGNRVYDIRDAIATAIEVYKDQGYIPSSETCNNKTVISERLASHDWASVASLEEADVIIDAFRKAENIEDGLMNNIKAIIDRGFVAPKEIGFLAYAPKAYEKHLERLERLATRQAEHEKEMISGHVASVGQKVMFEVRTMKLLTSFENDYGWTYMYKMTDPNGNVYIWYASRSQVVDEVRYISGTVKKHDVHDGVKQTVITRCKAA